MFPTTLTTDRLLLRPLEPDDAPALFERVSSDAEVTRFMSWATNHRVEETADFIRGCTNPETLGKPPWGQVWAIEVEGDGSPSGTIGLLPRAHRAELGYALAHAAWGRGFMSEAVHAVTAAALAHPEIWRVQAYTHPDNHGSSRVLEKCGFRREGMSRRMFVLPQQGDEPQDHWLYACVRDDTPLGLRAIA